MRKFEREVVDTAEKFAILGRCGYLTLALYGENAPYCLPLNFGAELQGEKLVLYFHCAKQGTKLALLQKDGRVGFVAANMLRVFNKGIAPCGYTTDYESVCGTGVAEVVEGEEERLHGLQVLMRHYTEEEFSPAAFQPHAMALTEVVKVVCREWTAKRLVRPQEG